LTGPEAEVGGETERDVISIEEGIPIIERELHRRKLLTNERPTSVLGPDDDEGAPFVIETMVAQKIIFNRWYVEPLGSLKEFALWVADPVEGTLPTEQEQSGGIIKGTFLYLTEAQWDDGVYRTTYSGCSALMAIWNYSHNDPLIIRYEGSEAFGRASYEHPIDKLKTFGAVTSERRKITSLYKKRYLSSEQCTLIGGREYRVNDLLAYPLFIAADI
jgi:hypothetical protein